MSDTKQTMSELEKARFVTAFRLCLNDRTFVKLSLGKSKGSAVARKVRITLVAIQDRLQLRFLSQFPTREVTENFEIETGIDKISELLGNDYLSGNLFTTSGDTTLFFNKRGKAAIHASTPTVQDTPSLDHNREKNYLVTLQQAFLVHLEITNSAGILKPTMASKFKQINRFVEIVDDLIRDSSLMNAATIKVADIGSGKGYLTFALFEHLSKTLGKDATVTGIERRSDLVGFCNQVAKRLGLAQLRFVEGDANKTQFEKVDIAIALHACNTATDDAIYRGVETDAAIIVCAPCCQHQIAPQLSKDNEEMRGIYRFGLLKQRQADLITDTARALLLESVGYRVKVIDFVSTEHTNKNLMLAAVQDSNVDRAAARMQYASLKKAFGFQEMELETMLGAEVRDAC